MQCLCVLKIKHTRNTVNKVFSNQCSCVFTYLTKTCQPCGKGNLCIRNAFSPLHWSTSASEVTSGVPGGLLVWVGKGLHLSLRFSGMLCGHARKTTALTGEIAVSALGTLERRATHNP